MKKLISLLIALVVMISLTPASLADGNRSVTLTSSTQLMEIVGPSDGGAIHITKATLKRDGNEDEIYLVLLSGIKSVILYPNNVPSSLASFISAPSSYLNKLIAFCKEKIPEGSKIVIAAHSLGGMVAQLFASDRSMKARYEILNITSFGSPLVNTIGQEGEMHRLLDISDPLFRLSITGIRNYKYCASIEDGGYRLFSVQTHVESYQRSDVWGEYDCFGVKGGNATITYSPTDMYAYPYPTLSLFKS